jgi:hypothetical protein
VYKSSSRCSQLLGLNGTIRMLTHIPVFDVFCQA